MDLKTYLRELGTDEKRRVLAEACGTSLQYLKFVGYRVKKPSESLCIAIERETKGEVPVESLRPDVDWHVIRTGAQPANAGEVA